MKYYYLEVLEQFGWQRVDNKKHWYSEYTKHSFREMINSEKIGPPLHGMYRIVDEAGKTCFTYNRRSKDGRFLWIRSQR